MPSPTVTTRFLILSDTHNFEFKNDPSEPLHLPLPKVDVLLHCGDLTNVGGPSQYKKALKLLSAIDAELKLVIAGNHDRDLDKHFWEHKRYGPELDDPKDYTNSIRIMTGSLAAEAGVTYLDEGTYTFTLRNGVTFSVYASPYTPEFCGWAFSYGHKEDRFNAPDHVLLGTTSIATTPIPDTVDIVMTHGPPKGILDECSQGSVGCPNLLQAMRRVRPRMHCFGHVHPGNGMRRVDWESEEGFDLGTGGGNAYGEVVEAGVGKGRETVFVNGAVMDDGNRAVNAPWVVDLELPRA